MEDLPRTFDAIILGTGMPESILAASLARIGMKVLHLDRNDYYSGGWATLNWVGLDQWVQRNQEGADSTEPTPESIGSLIEVHRYDDDADASLIQDGERLVKLPLKTKHYEDVNVAFHCPEKSAAVVEVPARTADVGVENIPPASSTGASGVASPVDKPETDSVSSPNSVVSTSREPASPLTGSQEMRISLNDDGDVGEPEETPPEPPSPVVVEKMETESKWTQDRLAKEWRRFNIDLAPKLLLSRGAMVDLLVSSDIAKYADFRIVSRILTVQGSSLKQVPCCRADVFNSKEVSVLEKRLLMKFLTFCMDCDTEAEENREICELPFEEYLSENQKLTPVLRNYVINAIAMAPLNATTKEGLKRAQTFLHSLGRYGNTPFLWTMYGSGELPQCFCRMCAVFGGIYILRKTARSVIVGADKDVGANRVKGVICTGGMRFATKWLIVESSYAPPEWISYGDASSSTPTRISRSVLMTDRSVFPADDNRDHVTLLNLPSKSPEDPHPISVLELGHTSMVTPKGLGLVHLTKSNGVDCREDFREAEELLFRKADEDSLDGDADKPNVLWSLRFKHIDTSDVTVRSDVAPCNFLVTSGPGAVLDYDSAVTQARGLFQIIAPDRSAEEFLPPAPNPEDIYVEEVEAPTSSQPPEASPEAPPAVSENNSNDSQEAGQGDVVINEANPAESEETNAMDVGN